MNWRRRERLNSFLCPPVGFISNSTARKSMTVSTLLRYHLTPRRMKHMTVNGTHPFASPIQRQALDRNLNILRANATPNCPPANPTTVSMLPNLSAALSQGMPLRKCAASMEDVSILLLLRIACTRRRKVKKNTVAWYPAKRARVTLEKKVHNVSCRESLNPMFMWLLPSSGVGVIPELHQE